MSIKQQIEINELRDRVDALELKLNIVSDVPRNVGGMPDPDPKPVQRKRTKKAEG